MARRVAAAAALGDRSENADYIYGKKQLREIDRRIGYLSRTLDQIKVVDQRPADETQVFFGAWVRVLDIATAVESVYRIIGADEIDLSQGHISIDSPVARALLKHRAGDDVVVKLGREDRLLRVIDVSYDPI